MKGIEGPAHQLCHHRQFVRHDGQLHHVGVIVFHGVRARDSVDRSHQTCPDGTRETKHMRQGPNAARSKFRGSIQERKIGKG